VAGSKAGVIGAASYFALAAAVIAYELSIFVRTPPNAGWTGMLSMFMTLPTCLAVAKVYKQMFGTTAGESHAAFVAIMGLSALVNAVILYFVISVVFTPRRN